MSRQPRSEAPRRLWLSQASAILSLARPTCTNLERTSEQSELCDNAEEKHPDKINSQKLRTILQQHPRHSTPLKSHLVTHEMKDPVAHAVHLFVRPGAALVPKGFGVGFDGDPVQKVLGYMKSEGDTSVRKVLAKTVEEERDLEDRAEAVSWSSDQLKGIIAQRVQGLLLLLPSLQHMIRQHLRGFQRLEIPRIGVDPVNHAVNRVGAGICVRARVVGRGDGPGWWHVFKVEIKWCEGDRNGIDQIRALETGC